MAFKKEQQFAYILAAVLLIVGVVSYAAFPQKTPDRPLRIMFQAVNGKVLFDHQTHTVESGVALSCGDCHHTLEAGETEAQACLECHERQSEDPDVPKRSDAFHRQCVNCHQEIEAGPKECNSCHVM